MDDFASQPSAAQIKRRDKQSKQIKNKTRIRRSEEKSPVNFVFIVSLISLFLSLTALYLAYSTSGGLKKVGQITETQKSITQEKLTKIAEKLKELSNKKVLINRDVDEVFQIDEAVPLSDFFVDQHNVSLPVVVRLKGTAYGVYNGMTVPFKFDENIYSDAILELNQTTLSENYMHLKRNVNVKGRIKMYISMKEAFGKELDAIIDELENG